MYVSVMEELSHRVNGADADIFDPPVSLPGGKALVGGRKDLIGVSAYPDYEATMATLSEPKTKHGLDYKNCGEARGTLRALISGSVRCTPLR